MLYLQAELPLRNADTVLHGVVEETYIHATLPRTNNLVLAQPLRWLREDL